MHVFCEYFYVIIGRIEKCFFLISQIEETVLESKAYVTWENLKIVRESLVNICIYSILAYILCIDTQCAVYNIYTQRTT